MTTEAEKRRMAEHYVRAAGGVPVGDFRNKEVEFLDVAIQPIEIQIPLYEYFERVKRLRVDRWQRHFCDWLQNAVATRHIKGSFGEFHAEPQLGKTTILSQVFKAWCYGHDPFWRAVLAMYNVTRSETHSEIIIQILRSATHKEIFPSKDGHLPNSLSKTGWNTNARMDIDKGKSDGQKSFSAVGLQSGITGSSADWYTIDDPYKDPKEAFSEQVRLNLDRFWAFGIKPRLTPNSCIAAMFHRYSYDDFGGYLLDTGLFDYVRYATICDGDYIHEETGQKFADPLGREIGEYISPQRRPPSYYVDKQKDTRVFSSMFQGRPSSEEGEFFQVAKIKKITPEQAEIERQECTVMVRAWDNAATTGAGDFTAGALMGMKADGSVIIFDMKLEQVDTAERIQLQQNTASEDGSDVSICIPKELASAGKDNVFFTEQYLKEYSVSARSVVSGGDAAASTPKARRAYNFSVAVNSGEVSYVSDDDLPEEKKWNKTVLRCLRQFLLSTFDDPVDALGDGYNFMHDVFRRGLVVKNYRPQRNLTPWASFAARFGNCKKIPANFTIYAGVKITADASTPNAAVIVVRAPDNANLGEKLFVVAEYKDWTANYMELFEWLDSALDAFCSGSKEATIWLHPDSESFKHVLWQKLERPVAVFDGDKVAGLTELDWYLKPNDKQSPFNSGQDDAGMYIIVHDANQMSEATDEYGMASLRQEFRTWGYNDKKEPSAIGAVGDCLRLVTHCFRTIAVELTKHEENEAALPVVLQVESLAAMPDSADKDSMLQRRHIEMKKIEKENGKPVRGAYATRYARR